MKAVNVFLAHFQSLVPTDSFLKTAISASIERHLKIKLSASMIKVERSGVYLQASPALKNLVFLHRETIIAEVAAGLREQKRSLL